MFKKKTPSPRKKKDSPPKQGDKFFSALTKPFGEVAKPFQKAAQAIKSSSTPKKNKKATVTSPQEEAAPPYNETNKPPSFIEAFCQVSNDAMTAVMEPVAGAARILTGGATTATSNADEAPGGGENVDMENDDNVATSNFTAMEPDKQLEAMNIVITKTLRGVSVRDWYDTCWSEGVQTDKLPFYGPWLTETGKTSVMVEDWTFGSFVGEWDKEEYQQQRTVTFQMERSSGLYPGSTHTDVTHTQLCRFDDSDDNKKDRRCVVSMTIRMQGIPFADAFQVQLRWVATGQNNGDLMLQLGLFVVFTKQVIVAGKIRSGTTEQTTLAQLDLFRKMKAACCTNADAATEHAQENNQVEEEEQQQVRDLISTQSKPLDLLAHHMTRMVSLCFPFVVPPPPPSSSSSGDYDDDSDDIQRVMREIRDNLRIIQGLPSTGKESDEDDFNHVLEEFQNAQDALDQCLLKFICKDKNQQPESERGEVDERTAIGAVEKLFGELKRPFEKMFHGKFGIQPGEPLLSLSKEEAVGVAVPDGPDRVLEAMNVIIDKEIPRASVRDLYEICFSEGNQTKSKPFYGPWLDCIGATAVTVGDWVFAGDGESFSDGWSDETYSQKRTVTYSMERKSVLGQETCVSDNTQKQYCRFDGNKRFVLQTSLDVAGFPFGDTFTVIVRWVATQSDGGGISIKVGVFVLVLKETLHSKKIRVEATQEAIKKQMELFGNVHAALGAGTSEMSVDNRILDLTKRQPFHCVALPLQSCLSKTQRLVQISPDGLLVDDEAVSEQLIQLKTKVRALEPFLEGRTPCEDNETWRSVLIQLELVDAALDNIIVWHGDKAKVKEALDRASFM